MILFMETLKKEKEDTKYSFVSSLFVRDPFKVKEKSLITFSGLPNQILSTPLLLDHKYLEQLHPLVS